MADENSLPVIFLPFLENLPLSSNKQRLKNVNLILSFFSEIIEEHKQIHLKSSRNIDILDNLLESNHQLSPKELLGNLFIFFLAGHHTTATALAFAITELADKPHIQERLYEEIITKFGTNSPPSFESISSEQSSEYLQNFILENLRLHPPLDSIPTRQAKADIPYLHQTIPKNTWVLIDIRNIQRHPQYWEEPDKFDPDRFLMERKKGRHKYAFLPFSLGKRQCIGNEFSFIEQRLFLVRLLQRYRILPPKEHSLKILHQAHPFGLHADFFIRLEKR
jgi:cytochrome P450